jgi:hypothetical protein
MKKGFILSLGFIFAVLIIASCAKNFSEIEWTAAKESKIFPARILNASLAFNGRIWVIGGWSGGYNQFLFCDVWSSPDGSNWTLATAFAPFYGRSGFTGLAFKNRIWVIGGQGASGVPKNDVWYSSNGINWTQATANASFPGRLNHSALILDGKMWVIGGALTGGYNPANFTNDVWYSSDGSNWTEACAGAPFSGRNTFAAVSFKGKMWVIGGWNGTTLLNDVWCSPDGIKWTQASSNAQFDPRNAHTGFAFDNKIWIIGGNGTNGVLGDVWYSQDGANWARATNAVQFPPRCAHTSVTMGGRMWIIGGALKGGSAWSDYTNDVWYSK